MEVHTGLLHGASPSSQYSLSDTAVKETGSNPAGTAPPAGWPSAGWLCAVAGAVVVEDEVVLVAVVVVVTETEVVVTGAAAVADVLDEALVAVVLVGEAVLCPPQAESKPAIMTGAKSTATGARQALTAADKGPTELLTLGPQGPVPSGPFCPGDRAAALPARVHVRTIAVAS